MYYDGNERIFWMRLNARAGKDTSFVGNATIPQGMTNIHVIHDFQYGELTNQIYELSRN